MLKYMQTFLGSMLLLALAAGVGPQPAQGYISGPPQEAALLGSLVASNSFCYQPASNRPDCFINWRQVSANVASPAYASSLSVEIDGKLRLKMLGVFENSFSISSQMLGRGFQVDCGMPGSGGTAGAGATHTYMVKATFSDSGYSSISGSLTCPSYKGTVFLPALERR